MILKPLKLVFSVVAVVVFTFACKDATTTSTTESLDIEQPSEQKTTQETQAAPAQDVVLNPPHGQPGHRCDIAVGQPLDSEPRQQSNANLNPPHGQPGHRCDIAVGQPLPQ